MFGFSGYSSLLEKMVSGLNMDNQVAVAAACAAIPKMIIAAHIMTGGKLNAKEAFEAAGELSSLGIKQFSPIVKKKMIEAKKEEKHQKKLYNEWKKSGFRAKKPKGLKSNYFPIDCADAMFGSASDDYFDTSFGFGNPEPSTPKPIVQLPPPVKISKTKKA